MQPDFPSLRREFPLLEHTTYLNSGSYGALANRVRGALQAYIGDRLRSGADWEFWSAKQQSVRTLTARLLNTRPEEIAITASVSDGLNALASALHFPAARNKIVVSDFEFPTNAQIWHAQEPRGARVVHVHPDARGDIPLEHFAAAIDEQTALVAVTHVCYRNGAKLDIAGIVRLARARGARVLLDCYQSVGSLQLDVRALDVDFAVGGMLKYLLGTAGLGFLYVRGSLIPALLPTHSGWLAQADVAAMDITANRPAADARRFEAGTPAVVNCYAAEAGLELILEVGLANIERRNYALSEACLNGLEEIGWPSVTPPAQERRGMTVAVPASDSAALTRALIERGIVVSHRDNKVRASFHFYNDEHDLARLMSALRELRPVYAGR